jgi:hypothetical protein
METGAIIGIVVGAVVVFLLLFCLCGHLSCWKPKIVYVTRDSIVFTLFHPGLNLVASFSTDNSTVSKWILFCTTGSNGRISARTSDDVSYGKSVGEASQGKFLYMTACQWGSHFGD